MDEVRLAGWLVAESAFHLSLFNSQTYAEVEGKIHSTEMSSDPPKCAVAHTIIKNFLR